MDGGSDILLVDDETIVRETLCAYLQACGHRVAEAEDGREALARLTEKPVDIILADVRMPVMDGLALLEQVRETHPDLPVVMMTGHGDAEMETKAQELGASGFLVKPIRLRDLDVLLTSLISGDE